MGRVRDHSTKGSSMKNLSNRQTSVWKWERVAAGDFNHPHVSAWLQKVGTDVLPAEKLKAGDMRAALPRAVQLDGASAVALSKDRAVERILATEHVYEWTRLDAKCRKKIRNRIAREALSLPSHALNQDGAIDARVGRVLKERNRGIHTAIRLVLEELGESDHAYLRQTSRELARSVAASGLGDWRVDSWPVEALDQIIVQALSDGQ